MIILSREQAIKEFRKMWEWIADQTLVRQKIVHKTDYFKENYLEPVHQDCYLCHYALDRYSEGNNSYMSYCKCCPIDFNKFNEEEETPFAPCSSFKYSPYNLWIEHYTNANLEGSMDEVNEAAHYAREVARLPERKY